MSSIDYRRRAGIVRNKESWCGAGWSCADWIGFDVPAAASDGVPLGMQFLGRPFTEPTLIKLASGDEAVSHHRKPAPLTPPLTGETFNY